MAFEDIAAKSVAEGFSSGDATAYIMRLVRESDLDRGASLLVASSDPDLHPYDRTKLEEAAQYTTDQWHNIDAAGNRRGAMFMQQPTHSPWHTGSRLFNEAREVYKQYGNDQMFALSETASQAFDDYNYLSNIAANEAHQRRQNMQLVIDAWEAFRKGEMKLEDYTQLKATAEAANEISMEKEQRARWHQRNVMHNVFAQPSLWGQVRNMLERYNMMHTLQDPNAYKMLPWKTARMQEKFQGDGGE